MHRRNKGLSSLTVKPRNDRCHGRATALFSALIWSLRRPSMKRVRLAVPPRVFPSRAREETPESRGIPCLFLNTERGFGGKPSKKSGFHRHLAGSKMPKETFFTAISRWTVISRRALDASGFWQG